MYSSVKSLEKSPLHVNLAAALFAVLLIGDAQLCAARQSSQTTFPSAEDASHALFVAVDTQDTRALMQILGQRNELISSSDAARDKLERYQFVRKYKEMHRLARDRDGKMVLYIGAENWPFPVPIVSHDGVWRYDSDAGEKEVLYRRIGENEITSIEVCHALVTAATKPQAPADTEDPVAALLATTKASNKPVLFQGYYFRVLPNSGDHNLALVAYPASYGYSGVMTFIIDGRSVVHQRDLGPSTAKIATAMATDHLDSTWTPVETGLGDPLAADSP